MCYDNKQVNKGVGKTLPLLCNTNRGVIIFVSDSFPLTLVALKFTVIQSQVCPCWLFSATSNMS